MFSFSSFIFLPIFLLFTSFWGILYAYTIINVFIALELAILACGLNYIFVSLYLDDIVGQIFAITTLSVAGVESALGLAGLVAYFRLRGNMLISAFSSLKS